MARAVGTTGERRRIARGLEPVVGIEPTTYALRKRCSTAELHRHVGRRTLANAAPGFQPLLRFAVLGPYANAGPRGPAPVAAATSSGSDPAHEPGLAAGLPILRSDSSSL